MQLHDLKPAPGSTHKRKRVGRGIGSGHGKTCCRGTKGQKARDTVPATFEGGQTPLHRRLPVRRGFRNPNKKFYAVINIERLGELFEANDIITPEVLLSRRIISELLDGVKVLGDGELKVALKVSAHLFSKSAEEKIIAVGGEVTKL
ncbi:MAG: 50S ribosomal protein L15 [bacterium]|jgi:large subunit ribosomal protein L15